MRMWHRVYGGKIFTNLAFAYSMLGNHAMAENYLNKIDEQAEEMFLTEDERFKIEQIELALDENDKLHSEPHPVNENSDLAMAQKLADEY